MCGDVRGTGRKQDSMAVSFFGGQDGAGARVWSSGKFVANHQDQEQLRARIRELESLCTDVLVAGVDIGLPQHLLESVVGGRRPRRIAARIQRRFAARAASSG